MPNFPGIASPTAGIPSPLMTGLGGLGQFPQQFQQAQLAAILAQVQKQQAAQQLLDPIKQYVASHPGSERDPKILAQVKHLEGMGGLPSDVTPSHMQAVAGAQRQVPASQPGMTGLGGPQGPQAGPGAAVRGDHEQIPDPAGGASPVPGVTPPQTDLNAGVPSFSYERVPESIDRDAFTLKPFATLTPAEIKTDILSLPAGDQRDSMLKMYAGVPDWIHTAQQVFPPALLDKAYQDFYGPKGIFERASAGQLTPDQYMKAVQDNGAQLSQLGFKLPDLMKDPQVMAGMGKMLQAKYDGLVKAGILSGAKAQQVQRAIQSAGSLDELRNAQAKYFGVRAQVLPEEVKARLLTAQTSAQRSTAYVQELTNGSWSERMQAYQRDASMINSNQRAMQGDYDRLMATYQSAVTAGANPDPNLISMLGVLRQNLDQIQDARKNIAKGPSGNDIKDALGKNGIRTPGNAQPRFIPGAGMTSAKHPGIVKQTDPATGKPAFWDTRQNPPRYMGPDPPP